MAGAFTSHPHAWAFELDVTKSIKFQTDGFSVLVLFSNKTRHEELPFKTLEDKHVQRLIEIVREKKMKLYDSAMFIVYRPNVKLFGMFGPTNYRPFDVPEFDIVKHCMMQTGYQLEDCVVVTKDGYSSLRHGNVKA